MSADLTGLDVIGEEGWSDKTGILGSEEVRDDNLSGVNKAGGEDTTRGFRGLLVNMALSSKSTRIVSREASGMMDRYLFLGTCG